MRFRVALQTVREVLDDGRVPSKQTTTFATVWAAITGLKGRDYWAAAAVDANDDQQVVIRYRTDVTTDCIAVINGVAHRIMSVSDVDGDKRYLTLMCRAVTSG